MKHKKYTPNIALQSSEDNFNDMDFQSKCKKLFQDLNIHEKGSLMNGKNGEFQVILNLEW